MNRQKPVKIILEKLLGVDTRRHLPEFAPETFMKWYQKNHQDYEKQGNRDVVLLVDLFTNYHEPDVAIAALKVLHHLGYNVTVPGVFPTGRPQLSKGFLEHAKQICVKNIERLSPYAEQGIAIVGLEPSELLTLRDEYLDLCEDSDLDSAKRISDNSFLWEEFLNIELATAESINPGDGKSVFVHGHCHTKALIGNESLLQAFKQMGFKPVELMTGCCGMAGSFGYQSNKYELSMKIGDEVLFPSLNELPEDAIICSPGFSCRHQIADGVQKRSQHPAVIMANAIASNQ